jgi:hypothetical protein
MMINVRGLADVLASRLNPQLPSGLWLTVGTQEGWGGVAVFMNSDEGSWGGTGIVNMYDAVDQSDVEASVRTALDAIQADVAHASRGVAWPSDPAAIGPLPEPWAKATGNALSFGYGSVIFGRHIDLSQLVA